MDRTAEDIFLDELEELKENSKSKFFEELFTTEEERNMYCVDFEVFRGILCDWVDEEEKIDPNIARYMGMVLLGVANRLEDDLDEG